MMSQPADLHPALTIRDDPLATRRDLPDLTVRDDALPPQTLMNLPPTLAARYRIVQPLLTIDEKLRQTPNLVTLWD